MVPLLEVSFTCHHLLTSVCYHKDLHLLHTDPAFQKRGAGGQLVKWGTRRADELGLPTYLESSSAGHRFYQSHGFKDIEILQVDFSPWGGPVHEQPLMIRDPDIPS